MKVFEFLRFTRVSQGLSLRDMEYRMDRRLSHSELGRIELGQIQEPSVSSIVIIARALSLDPIEVLRIYVSEIE